LGHRFPKISWFLASSYGTLFQYHLGIPTLYRASCICCWMVWPNVSARYIGKEILVYLYSRCRKCLSYCTRSIQIRRTHLIGTSSYSRYKVYAGVAPVVTRMLSPLGPMNPHATFWTSRGSNAVPYVDAIDASSSLPLTMRIRVMFVKIPTKIPVITRITPGGALRTERSFCATSPVRYAESSSVTLAVGLRASGPNV